MFLKKIIERFSLETPFIFINKISLINNIERMQNLANENNLKLRPHIKSHKCLEIANLQKEYGASGITCSKVSEAIPFIENGFKDVLIAYPLVDGRKIQKIVEKCIKHKANLSLIVDRAISNAVGVLNGDITSIGFRVGVKVDVGLGRCGIDIQNDEVEFLTIIERIKNDPWFGDFYGIVSHAGQSYGAGYRDQLISILNYENDILSLASELIKKEFGILDMEISTGSTPSVLAARKKEDFGISTEIRPGNYVFNDKTPLRLGLVTEKDCSLTVVSQVVSENDLYWICDAGSKTLTSDGGAHGTDSKNFGKVKEFNQRTFSCEVLKLSEEHGFLGKTKKNKLEIRTGDFFEIIPNHSCPICNLADELIVFDEFTEEIEKWPVISRGMNK